MFAPITKKLPLSLHLWLLALAVALYVVPVLIFHAPANPTYHFTPLEIFLLSITIMTPWVATWILGVTSYIRLERYARTVKDETGVPFRFLARGIMVLVWGMILASLASSVRSYHLNSPDVVVYVTVLSNYVYAFSPLAGFYFIWKGIQGLGNEQGTKAKPRSLAGVMTALGVIALASVFLVLIFTNPNRQAGLSASIPATYYLPDWLIVLTIVLPVVVSWALGITAVARTYQYQRVVSGFIYRRFMSTLAYGIVLIISGSILLQGLQSVGAQRLLSGGLQSVLIWIYVFLLLQFVGYMMVSRGSRKLTLIETA